MSSETLNDWRLVLLRSLVCTRGFKTDIEHLTLDMQWQHRDCASVKTAAEGMAHLQVMAALPASMPSNAQEGPSRGQPPPSAAIT